MAERRASSLGVIMAVAMVVIMAVLGLGLVAAEEDPWPDAPRYKGIYHPAGLSINKHLY